MIRTGNRYPQRLCHGTRQVHALMRGSRAVYASHEAQSAILTQWLADEVQTVAVMVDDTVGSWLEVELTFPAGWHGSAATGYSGPLQAGGESARFGLQFSTDLAAWTAAGWEDSPGSAAETLGDGRRRFYARYAAAPKWYFSVLVDLTLTCDRYGKSITAVSVLGADVSLPGFPYAMPADAGDLQADLRAEGFTGAVVSTTSAALSVGISNHTPDGRQRLTPTLSGANVTGVSFAGSAVSLPAFPYAMPGSRATLQTHLRSAGFDGAVVMLFDDPWSIFLPDLAAGAMRPFSVTIDPGDPFPTWDFFGNYNGLSPATAANGEFGNVRTPTGAPLVEHGTGFARLSFLNP